MTAILFRPFLKPTRMQFEVASLIRTASCRKG